MLRVVEGGCRFAEIDAVLRKVRFFFLGIPFKCQPLHIGAIWDNVNITLQYNLVGNWPSGTVFSISTDEGPAGFERCNAFNRSTLQRCNGCVATARLSITRRQPALAPSMVGVDRQH